MKKKYKIHHKLTINYFIKPIIQNNGCLLCKLPKHKEKSPGNRDCPFGLLTGVPLTTTDDARPWYPTGKCNLKNVHNIQASHNGYWIGQKKQTKDILQKTYFVTK